VSDATIKPKRAPWMGVLPLALFGILVFVVNRTAPFAEPRLWRIASLGFLLIAGTLVGELIGPLGLPHLTGYLIAGLVAGPHALGLFDQETVRGLSPANTLALALIALAGGAELEITAVRKGLRSLSIAICLQTTLVFVVSTAGFLALRPFIPFARALPIAAAVGTALCWGAVAVTRSPSATLGILSQTRAAGALASFTLAFVMLSDIVVVVLIALVLAIARPLIEGSGGFSSERLVALGHDLFGSVAIGTTLGIFIAAYLRFTSKQMLLVLLVLGFGVSSLLDYLRFDSLLAFMVAGFIVRNLSKQGKKFILHIERTATLVYVVFFAIAGADLDVPLLKTLWPVALALATTRVIATWTAGRVSSSLARDPPALVNWAWSGLVSQAGLAIGLALVVAREFPAVGGSFRSLAIATVALNELAGPVLFKSALDRCGETRAQPPILPEGATG
jgi:Kef-type K+ transport system membrane component KefB